MSDRRQCMEQCAPFIGREIARAVWEKCGEVKKLRPTADRHQRTVKPEIVNEVGHDAYATGNTEYPQSRGRPFNAPGKAQRDDKKDPEGVSAGKEAERGKSTQCNRTR